jgi:hypothetical protein
MNLVWSCCGKAMIVLDGWREQSMGRPRLLGCLICHLDDRVCFLRLDPLVDFLRLLIGDEYLEVWQSGAVQWIGR